MNPVGGAGLFLINLVFSFLLYLFVLRLWLQKFGASVFNPVSQFVVKLSTPIVKPFRYVFGGFRGFDFSLVFLIVLTQWLMLFITAWIYSGSLPPITQSILAAIVFVIRLNINFFIVVVIMSAILSWVSQSRRSPISEIVNVLALPLLSFVRRYVPLVSGFDFSPIVVLVTFHLIDILFLSPLIYWSAMSVP